MVQARPSINKQQSSLYINNLTSSWLFILLSLPNFYVITYLSWKIFSGHYFNRSCLFIRCFVSQLYTTIRNLRILWSIRNFLSNHLLKIKYNVYWYFLNIDYIAALAHFSLKAIITFQDRPNHMRKATNRKFMELNLEQIKCNKCSCFKNEWAALYYKWEIDSMFFMRSLLLRYLHITIVYCLFLSRQKLLVFCKRKHITSLTERIHMSFYRAMYFYGHIVFTFSHSIKCYCRRCCLIKWRKWNVFLQTFIIVQMKPLIQKICLHQLIE